MEKKVDFLGQAEADRIPVALYGAGKYGRIALTNIQKKYPNINIQCFVDDDLVRNSRDVEGIEVISLDKVPGGY